MANNEDTRAAAPEAETEDFLLTQDETHEVEKEETMDVDIEEKAREEAEAMNVDAVVTELESKHALLQEEHEACKEQLESQSKDLSESRDQVKLLNDEKLKLEQQLAEARRLAQSSSEGSKTLEVERKSQKERVDRMEAEADSLREEISRLTKSNKELNDTLSEMEVKSKLSNSEIAPLLHENQRLQTEIDSISTHCQWLEGELKRRMDEYMELKKTHGAQTVSWQNELDQLSQEKEAEATRLTTLKRSEEQLQNKVEQLSKQLLLQKNEQAEAALVADQELSTSRRLVELQKEQLDRLEKKNNDLHREMEGLQAKANQALEEARKERQQRVERESQSLKTALEDQAKGYEAQLKNLANKLTDSNRRRVEIEDRFLALPSTTTRLALTSGEDDMQGPVSLTDLSTRLVETKTALASERALRKKMELRFERLQIEIEAKAPILIRQRQEYEVAMKRQDEFQRRLDEAIEEITMHRSESRELKIELSRANKKNQALQEEAAELARQVQALLMSRSGIEVNGDIPTSIEEIQSQNQRLLSEHRRMTAQVKELEDQLKSDRTRQKLEEAEKEVQTLNAQRVQQEHLVAGIVQQRDLYRALLSKHDTSLLGSKEEEITAIEMTKRQSDRAKALQSKNEALETDIASAKGELDRVTRDKDVIADRLTRSEAVVISLTKNVDNLQMELRTAKADVGRAQAECSYYTERAARFEESLKNAKKEIEYVANAKGDLQRINNDLQNAVTAASAQTSEYESEKHQLQSKLRLAETQVATVKAAEKRIMDENTQLRSELARQGGLLDSVRRIEASLAAKKDEETAKIKEECDKLSAQLSKLESKHTVELESMSSKIHELEAKEKELQDNSDKAKKESLLAQKKVLSKQEEIQKLTTKCATLASQLHSLRKKYGETEDAADVDVTLQARIKALTSELDAVKSELASQKEAAENYKTIAKTSETALADLTRTTQEFRKAREEEIEKLNTTLAAVRKENQTKQEMVSELTNDLMKVRGEQNQEVDDLKNKIASLQKDMDNYQKDAEAANARVGGLTFDLKALQEKEKVASNNYERELSQHAACRTELRKARSEAEEERRSRVTAEEQFNVSKKESDQLRQEFAQEKTSIEEALKSTEKRLKDAQAQNDLLHSQLEAIGDLADKTQASRVEAAAENEEGTPGDDPKTADLIKTISELRETIRYLRNEKEILQADADAAKRNADREKAAATVVRRSLDEARAELQVLTAASIATEGASDAAELAKKLQSSEDQLKLLRDSNQLLRDEAEKLKKSLALVQSDLDASKKGAEPGEKRQRELEVEKAALEAEKASLVRELESWKGRVQSLVSKFNQVDPEEHKEALNKVEAMTKEMKLLKTAKESAESESVRMRNIATKLNKEVAQQKKLNETQKKMVAQLNAQKEAMASSKNTLAAAERDQLKEKVAKIEKDLNSTKTELEGANDRCNKLRDRLRQFQKIIKELREKEKTLEGKLAEAQKKQQQQPTGDNATAPAPALAQEADTTSKSDKKPQATQPKLGENSSLETEAKLEPLDAAPAKASRDELLRLPPGGFKFGPNDSEADKTSTPAPSPKEDIQCTDDVGKESAKLTDVPVPSTEEEVAAAIASATSQQPASPKAAPAADGKKTLPPRRNSGAKKELSMKEKLLEKKRLLQEKMQRKKEMQAARKAAEEAKQVDEPPTKRVKTEEESSHETGEPEMKRPKVEDASQETTEEATPSEAPTTEAGSSSLNPAATAFMPSGTTTQESDSAKQSEKSGKEEGEKGEVANEMQGEDVAAAEQVETTLTAPVPAPAVATFGSTGFSSTTFGAKAPFGTGFGAGAAAFGKSTTSTSGFGSTPGAAFGEKAKSSDSSGGAFLDISPPGAQAAPPTFSFGGGSTIKLPTPSQPFRQASAGGSPFGVFSGAGAGANSPFGAFGSSSSGAMPLFGSQAAAPGGAEESESKEESKKEDKEGEDPGNMLV